MRELNIKEVRALPIGTKILVKGPLDTYRSGECTIVGNKSGKGKELRYDTWNGCGRMPIKRPWRFFIDDEKGDGVGAENGL